LAARGFDTDVSTSPDAGNPNAMSDDGMAETIATTGLFLNFIAVIAIAVCLASWGASHTATAALAGTIAVLSFAVSIACFRAQAEDHDQEEVPAG
jgi:F0F1-type ATP synthase assembly protein I